MKFVLFFNFLILFFLINLCSVNSRIKQIKKELINSLDKNSIQNEIDNTEKPTKDLINSTDEEIIRLDKEKHKIKFDKTDTSPSLINLFKNSTILIETDLKNNQTTDSTNDLKDNSTNDLDEFYDYNSTSSYDEDHSSLFEIDKDQLLIDGYQTPDYNKSFLIDDFVNKLKKEQKLSATIRYPICLKETCDQKILLITIDKLVLKYELIKQNIFLDKTAKYYDYLNCFYIQYNPNFGLRSYLRNGFTFNSKKAFINDCLDSESSSIYGNLYLTDDFKNSLKQNNLTTNVIQIKFDAESNEYQLSFVKENRPDYYNQLIKNLNGIYKVHSTATDQISSNTTCEDNEKIKEYIDTFNNLLKIKNNKIDNKIKLLTELNSTLFNDGIHQKLNKFKFLKAQIVFDSGLLTVVEKENFKILNHLFQIIYESQNYFKQLNIYLVVTRFRYKLPNELEIFSDTNLKMNVSKLFNHFKNSNQDTYFDLPADFKLVFLSFKFFYQNTTRLLPSYSDGLIGNPNSPAITLLDFSYLQTNHWLLSYEIAHLFGINDDADECKCLSDHCIMKKERNGLNELTWSNCTIKQFNSNLVAYKFELDLQIDKTEFRPDFFNYSICQNGVLESDELCDCGKFGCYFFNYQLKKYEQNQCCNSTTCKLNDPKFQCALGSCCDLSNNCTFSKPEKVCRSSHDICDIEEKCTGASGFCPVDDYYVNGELCGLNR